MVLSVLLAIIFTIKNTESLSHNLQALIDAPIIELDTIDSTNNYAMQLVDADTAQPGLTIITQQQLQGKGQRGRQWLDIPGQSLLMSIVLSPNCTIEEQFLFNATVAIAVSEVLTSLYENWDIRIKWPNDIIINDKKAGGILIENVLRGNKWSFCIVGLGLNIAQVTFPDTLPFATSLKAVSGKDFNRYDLFQRIRENILARSLESLHPDEIMKEYNEYLYKKDRAQSFSDGSGEWKAIIRSAGSNGMLTVQLADGSLLHYNHGTAQWKWE
jgi:BirA family biotin operon repressor/biotin-[acetyl-CoA-carboxylase] ligase